jgi:hypothetical protein
MKTLLINAYKPLRGIPKTNENDYPLPYAVFMPGRIFSIYFAQKRREEMKAVCIIDSLNRRGSTASLVSRFAEGLQAHPPFDPGRWYQPRTSNPI